MRVLSVHDNSHHFLQELAQAKRRVLVVDYDSVIAPLDAQVGAAFPYPSVPELLDCIMTTSRTRVVLITGRGSSDLLPPVPGPAPDIWANEELCTPADDSCSVPALTTSADDLIASVLTSGGEDTAVAYLSHGQGLYAAVTEMPASDAVAHFHPAPSHALRQEGFVQFLVDWLRICGGEIC